MAPEAAVESQNTVEALTPELPAEAREKMTEAERMLEAAQSVVIESDEAYQGAADQLAAIKSKEKELDAQRKAITKPLDDAKKRVMDMFRQPQEWLQRAEQVIKKAMFAYQREQQRLADERQREAERKAEQERRRAERLAEQHEAKGNEDKAEEWRERAETTEPAIVDADKPKAQGVSTRKNWKADVVDMQALCRAVADGHAPARLVQANTTELGKYARALQEDAKVPGVRFYAEDVVAARSR